MVLQLIICTALLFFGLALIGETAGTLPGDNPAGAKEVTTDSGLRYIDLIVGKGHEAQLGDTASVHYTGWLEDGRKFDSSLDRKQPFDFRLGAGRVIRGWDEGVMGMHIGGKRKLIIPPDLGYGTRGAGNVIAPNATLIFDVELLDLK